MASIHTIMPGSFSFDTTLPPKLDISGAKSHFFQPPKTPSASSSLHRSTASLPTQHVINAPSHKPSRHDPHSSDQAKPFKAQSHASPSMLSYIPSALESPSSSSPMPFANTQYRLAGGLDTPTARLTMDQEEGQYPTSPDLHLRGSRGLGGFQLALDSYFPQSTSALSRESNGRPRQHASPRIQDGLGKAVYGMVSAAGKVWDFCRTTAFKGFYAGGGRGYELKPPLEHMNCDQSMWEEAECEDVFQSNLCEKSSVPGFFPEEDFIADYMSRNPTTPPRAAKKIQREKGMGEEISASWVLVSTSTSREASPSRLSSRKIHPSNTSARRPIPKLGKRPILPASRPSLTSYAGSPGLRSDRSASFASPRSPIMSPKHESPLSAEVRQQAARIRKRELEEDANLKRFNQQLKAMIKEGKEALGTKFEVLEPVDEANARGEIDCGGRKR